MEKIINLKCKLQALILRIDGMISKIVNLKIMNENDCIIDEIDDVLNTYKT